MCKENPREKEYLLNEGRDYVIESGADHMSVFDWEVGSDWYYT